MEGKAEKRESVDVASLAALIERLADLEKKNTDLEQRLENASKLRTAVGPRERLKAMTAGESRSYGRSEDKRDPTALARPGFREDDLVRYKEGTNKATVTRAYLEKAGQIQTGAALPPGIVLRYMYTTKHGLRKYKVDFPGIGKDGVTEDELELA